MNVNLNRYLFTLIAFSVFSISAQDSSDESANLIEDVIVTSRRREEAAQSVPVAISAFSSSDLLTQNITTTDDLDNVAPNLSFFQDGAVGNATSIGIRGVGSSFTSSVREPSVGVYIDGAYISRQQGNIFDLWDISRVEVIRGPQGTLFGRNNTTGAIQLVYNKPSDEVEAAIKVGFGSRNLQSTSYLYNTPISENISLRITGSDLKQQGHVLNTETSQMWGEKDMQNNRIQLRYSPTNDLNIDLSHHMYTQNGKRNLGACRILNTSAPLLGAYSIAQLTPAIIENCNSSVPGKSGSESSSGDMTGETSRTILSIEQDLEFGTLTINHSNTKVESSLASWGMGLESQAAPFISPQNIFMNGDYDSTEIRLNGSSGKLDWVIGYFEFNETATSYAETVYFNNYLPDPFFQTIDLTCIYVPQACVGGVNYAGSILVSAYAAILGVKDLSEFSTTDSMISSDAMFLEGTYALTNNLNITAGWRTTSDNKKADTSWIRPTYSMVTGSINRPVVGTPTPQMAGCVQTLKNNGATCSGDKDFDDDTMRLILDYTFDNGNIVYASYSEGFASGGFQNDATLLKLAPEYVDAIELGTKGTYMDGRLRFNASYFVLDYQNKQQSIGYISESGSAINTSQSVESVEITGHEVELTYFLSDNLAVMYSLGETDGTYNKFISVIDGKDLSNNPYNAFGPESNTSFSIMHMTNIDGIDITSNLSLDMKGNNILNLSDNVSEPEYEVLNFTQSINFNNSVSMQIYGKNILDEVYATNGYGSVELAGFFTKYYAPGSEYGLNLTKTF